MYYYHLIVSVLLAYYGNLLQAAVLDNEKFKVTLNKMADDALGATAYQVRLN